MASMKKALFILDESDLKDYIFRPHIIFSTQAK